MGCRWLATVYVFKDPRRTKKYVVEYRVVRCKSLESALASAENMLQSLRRDIGKSRRHCIEYVSVEVKREK